MLVFAQAVLPYLYTRSLTEFKKRTRHISEDDIEHVDKQISIKEKITLFLKSNLNAIQDLVLKNVKPVHLAIFYFFGAYYNFSKRFTGIRYVN
jgi:peroxin-10